MSNGKGECTTMVGIGIFELIILLVVLALFVVTPVAIVWIIVAFSRRQDHVSSGELARLRDENQRLQDEIESLKRRS